jgi:hypothetical protein
MNPVMTIYTWAIRKTHLKEYLGAVYTETGTYSSVGEVPGIIPCIDSNLSATATSDGTTPKEPYLHSSKR